MLKAILISISLSVLFGPIIVMLEMFMSKLLVEGVSDPSIILIYPFALIPSVFVAAPLATAYAITLHTLLSWKSLNNVVHSCLLGGVIGFFYGAILTSYVAYQSQLKANALYIGKLVAFKPKQVFLESLLSDTNIMILVIPSLLCGALIPLLLPRPNNSVRDFPSTRPD